MPHTYTQLYVELVFSPKNRAALIREAWKDDLEKYITGIVQNHKNKLLAIGTMPDHIHLLIGHHPDQVISELVENIKTSSNAWVKAQGLSKFKFEWQKGYGAFSHSHSRLDKVIQCIRNQEHYHQKKTFREEYLQLLQKNEVDFSEEYLFDFFGDVAGWE